MFLSTVHCSSNLHHIFYLTLWAKDLVSYLLEKVQEVPQSLEHCYPIHCARTGLSALRLPFILCFYISEKMIFLLPSLCQVPLLLQNLMTSNNLHLSHLSNIFHNPWFCALSRQTDASLSHPPDTR